MLWCLHGFLGRGADWDGLRAGWPRDLPALRTPDLFTRSFVEDSLEAFGAGFADRVAHADSAPVLLGYSLGGRLALHALLARPGLWRGAIVVSAHLGLPDEAARGERLATDASWAAHFQTDPWDRVVAEWNAREVFGGRPQSLPRREAEYDREALAHGLDAWSLGRQAFLAPRLATLRFPVLWVAGADDTRYADQARLAASHGPTVQVQLAANAGHRVPWEQPDWFARELVAFVREPTGTSRTTGTVGDGSGR